VVGGIEAVTSTLAKELLEVGCAAQHSFSTTPIENGGGG